MLVKIAPLTRWKRWGDRFRGHTVTTSPERRSALHPRRPTEPDATPCKNAPAGDLPYVFRFFEGYTSCSASHHTTWKTCSLRKP